MSLSTRVVYHELRGGSGGGARCWISRSGAHAALLTQRQSSSGAVFEQALAVLDRESEAIASDGSAPASLCGALEQALGKDLQLLGVALFSVTSPNELSALVRGPCSLFAIDAGANIVRDLLAGKSLPSFERITLPLRADQRVR